MDTWVALTKANEAAAFMPSQRYAVVVVANDKILDFFIPFLESFRESNPALRLIVVPFDDDVAGVRLLTTIYNFELLTGRFYLIDGLAEMLFGREPYLKSRLRKLHAFDLELDEFIYIDVDVLIKQRLDAMFGRIRPGKVDLVYVASARAVYKESMRCANITQRHDLFASGIFVSSPRVTQVKEIYRVMAHYRRLFLDLRVPHLYDQPLLNFFFEITGRQVRQARHFGIHAVYSCVYSDRTLRFDGDGDLIKGLNSNVTLLHWAGPKKRRNIVPLRQVLLPYVRRAQQRLEVSPELAGWTPRYQSDEE